MTLSNTGVKHKMVVVIKTMTEEHTPSGIASYLAGISESYVCYTLSTTVGKYLFFTENELEVR